MTLSGRDDREERRQAAREARQARATEGAAKRPWLIPLLIGIAVLALGYALVIGITRYGLF